MSARRLAAHAAFWVIALTTAAIAVLAADSLPITDPATAWCADVAAGCGALAILTRLPCPCHRKDQR